MGRVLTITKSNDHLAGARKKTINREITIGPNAIKFIGLLIFAVLAVVYLTESTAGANRSIKIRDLEDKRSNLQLERERLEVEQTRLRSLKEIENGFEKTTLEPNGQVSNITP